MMVEPSSMNPPVVAAERAATLLGVAVAAYSDHRFGAAEDAIHAAYKLMKQLENWAYYRDPIDLPKEAAHDTNA
jgi:hypothetical protein